MKPEISVVVPTFQEADSIEDFLRRVTKALRRARLPAEILVVDDDSPDGTADLAERFVEVRVIRRTGPRSLSLSVLDGAAQASAETIVVLDADLSHDPSDIPRICDPVRLGAFDVAIGSRYTGGGRIAEWPLRRRILSRVGRGFARALIRVGDPLSGFFAAKRELLRDGGLEPRGYKILLEILGRYRGLQVKEVPIRFQDRAQGKSKFGVRQGLQFLRQVFTLLRIRAKGATISLREIVQ